MASSSFAFDCHPFHRIASKRQATVENVDSSKKIVYIKMFKILEKRIHIESVVASGGKVRKKYETNNAIKLVMQH